MEEQLISFETAKLAKEKGLKPPIMEFSFYKHSGKLVTIVEIAANKDYKEDFFYAPTQSLLQRWLREKYSMNLEMYRHPDNSYNFRLSDKNSERIKTPFNTTFYESYEEALEEGLQEALKLIK